MLQFILLQNPTASPDASPFGNLGMLFPLLILGVFFFFIIRPQMKRQKEQQKFTESLKEGMEVVTSSGIIGRVTKIEANSVRLMIDDKTFMRVLRSSIVGEYNPAG